MAASGKSHLGKILAKKFGYKFIDLDDVMEKITGMTTSEIRAVGEEYYLKIEKQAAFTLENVENIVIAPGGSVVYIEEVMNFLKKKSKVIYINVDFQILKKRIERRVKNGTLNIIGLRKDNLRELIEARQKLYKKYADMEVFLDSENPKENIKKILDCL